MAQHGYTSDEIAARGKNIYETQLRDKLESENIGKFLIIDIETGEYEMDEDHVIASKKASCNTPGRARYGMRIGYAVSGTIGNAMIGAKR